MTTKDCTDLSIEETVKIAEITVKRDAKCQELMAINTANRAIYTKDI